MKKETESYKSVDKAMRILMSFQPYRPVWGVRELSGHLGFSPATVQRLLRALMKNSFVVQDPETRQYRLGTVYFHFVNVLQSTYPVTQAARPFLKELGARTQETVHLSLLAAGERICVDRVESTQRLKGSLPVGERAPLYAGASAKCLLAFSPPKFVEDYLSKVELVALTQNTLTSRSALAEELAQIVSQGYAVSVGERTPGLASISAPIFDHGGTLLASVGLAIPELRFGDTAHRAFCLEALLETAGQISEAMGYSSPKRN